MADEYAEYEPCVENTEQLFVGDSHDKGKRHFADYSTETDTKVSNLKRSLEAWREILLPINAILHWEKQWHPLSVVGCSTMFFMMLWLLDPSILTTVSLIGLTLTLSDYLVPHLATSLLKTDVWTEKQEEKYDRICRSIILKKDKISLTCRSFCLLRSTRPKLYYSITVISLIFLAWIGNNVNNLLLTYGLVTFICLMPGMEQHGILQKYGSIITDKIADMATNAKLNVADLKKDK